jgi:hypothetical protein
MVNGLGEFKETFKARFLSAFAGNGQGCINLINVKLTLLALAINWIGKD